jgi:RHS repeat-associated protein
VTIASLTVTPAALVGSNDVAATVILTAPAPAAGVEVELASDHPAVVVPSVVTVPSGATQASFVIATSVVPSTVTATVSATHAVTTKTAAVTVHPPLGNHVSSLVVPALAAPLSVVVASVSLASPSDEPAGTDVALVTSDPLASAPATVRVKRHERSASFEIAVGTAPSSRRITIEARYGGVVQRATLVVTPPGTVVPVGLTLSPDRVTSGSTVSAVVTLSGPAPAGGAVVDLAARRRKMVAMPNSVTIPAGAASVAFTIIAEPVHGKPRVTEIDATLNGITATATLTVDPAPKTASTTRAVALCASASLQPCLTRAALDAAATATTPTMYEQQFTIYSPELSLLAETASTMSETPAIAYEYVWFAGQPLAQIDNATGAVDWYFNDHLGTPILQTDTTGRIVWRAEYDPYGTVLAFRQGEAKHQPLRLPGQTAEAGSGRYYNVFRWYRAGWGRYTQSDPMGLKGGLNLYRYANANPTNKIDPLGLAVNVICRRVDVGQDFAARFFGAWFQPVHCRLQVTCPCSDGQGNPRAPFNQTVGMEYVNGGYQLNTDQFLAPLWGGPSQDYERGWFNVPVRPPGGSRGCNFERCILNEARARQSTTPQSFPPYAIAGPNSNSYVRNLVDTCGGSADWPDNAYGANPNPAWGGNYQPGPP